MIARVAAVLSSSRDCKENVLQFAPDNSQQDNKTLQVTNTSRTKLGKTYHLNFARWRRGSCAGRIPSLLKPIFARIAARKGLGTVSRPGTIECAPCSIPCQYLGQATHKILKWVYRRKKETLQSESMTAIDTCMQDTYRKGCENESSAKVMLHVHTCAKWVICMMRDWLVKKGTPCGFSSLLPHLRALAACHLHGSWQQIWNLPWHQQQSAQSGRASPATLWLQVGYPPGSTWIPRKT